MSVVLLIIGLLLFVGLVVFHEFGHFIAARRNGVEVEEFGIGFPPRAWARKTKKGFLFTLNWLPIGGFVRMKGENDSATEAHSFGAASFKTKAKIMLAGVFMNLLAAFVIFTVLAWVGMPQIIEKQFKIASDTKTVHSQILVGSVESGSPADKAGLKTRDQLLSIQGSNGDPATDPLVGASLDDHVESRTLANGQRIEFVPNITSASELPKLTKKLVGQKVRIVYEREDKLYTTTTTLRTEKEAKGKAYLGLAPAEFSLSRATWSAPIQSAGLIAQFTEATFKGLGTAIGALFQGDTSRASEQVSGPVGIVVVLHDGSLLGYQFVLLVIGIISLSLAIMNVLPIPALDGGRFYVLLLSRLFGKKLSQDMEERIVGASFIFLLLLIVLITIVDVKRFF